VIPRNVAPQGSVGRGSTVGSMALWLSIIGLSVGALLATTSASAEDVAECAQRAVAFDGITPLSYATVSGATGSKDYLHAQFPAQCTPGVNEPCESSAYVLPGDVVGVGKTCGPWAYVQYIGEKRVTTGWLASSSLAPQKKLSAQPPSRNDDYTGENVRRYPFKLTKGRGIPVCEAYLQRLNSTLYSTPPFCGRPENNSVPGFEALTRVPDGLRPKRSFLCWGLR
jgi:hypothetical protein